MKRMITVMILLAAAVGVTGSTAWAVEPAGKLSKSELKSLILTAKTPAQHMKLASYYRYELSQLQADIKEHEEMADAYDKNPAALPKAPTPAAHCRNMVRMFKDAAAEVTEMVAMHDAMAKAAK